MVDYSFYATVYRGMEADEASFPALCARAEDVIGAMTRWQVTESTIANLPDTIQMLYKKAICAQVDSFAINGLDSVTAGNDVGFTVGKVSVNKGSSSASVAAGSLVGSISPMATAFLEQTGLLYRGVPVAPDPFIGRWY